jgi:glycosyltransferase involved in cell wall biosynthesis
MPMARDLRAWPYNIRDLVDTHYVRLQTGRNFETSAAALDEVLSTRPRHAVTIHPLIEPGWMLGRQPQSVVEWFRALRTPGSVRALGPLFSLERAGGTSADKPFDVLRRFLTTATDETILPAVDARVSITWGEARELLYHHARVFAAQNQRTKRRARDEWDDDVEARFRAELKLTTPVVEGSEPRVSVVMPVYNRASVVGRAIESVMAQSFEDWELIVVDDGSSDDTREVVREFIQRDSRVRLVEGQRGGVSRARNTGVEASHGSIVAFIDSDNAWRPDFLLVSVSAMAQFGVRITYAGIKRYESDGVIQYVGLQAGRDYLLDGLSFVDLNVLVVERALLDETGLFDTALRRWVDFDLVLRLFERADAKYLPIIGVDYEHEETSVGRITTSERSTWRDVVLGKYLVDWNAVSAEVDGRISGRLSVLLTARHDWHLVHDCIASILREADSTGIDVEVIVLDNASSHDFSSVLAAVFATESRVILHREPNDRGPAISANIAFARSTGEYVLRLSGTAVGRRGWLSALVTAIRSTKCVGVHGVVLDESGAVGDAGYVFNGADRIPRAFLRGLPIEDLHRSRRTLFRAGAGRALLVRAVDFASARGFDASFGTSLFDVDLCLRLGDGEAAFELVPEAVFQDPALHDDRLAGMDAEAASAFRERWAGEIDVRDSDHGLDLAGFRRVGWSIDDQVGLVPPQRRYVRFSPLRSAIPDLVRIDGRPRRWAIKISTPAAPRGDTWGDTFFAADLAHALTEAGQEVVVDRVEGHFRRTRGIDDVVLTIRGLAKVPPQPGAVNVLWVISHPDLVSDEEIRSYDLVYAAGAEWARQAAVRTGVTVRPLLQATSPERFSPERAAADSGHPVVFVGTPRKAMRPIVQDAIDSGHPPAIYGNGWEQYVPLEMVEADHLSPSQVGAVYRSAGVVLNDHWKDMARWGFISNRVFDVAAAGGRVISDSVTGLDDVFGGVVKSYREPEELRAMLAEPRSLVDQESVLELSARIRQEHSFAARAATIISDVETITDELR